MKFPALPSLALATLVLGAACAAPAAAPQIIGFTLPPQLTIRSDTNVLNQVQYSTSMNSSNWTTLTNQAVRQSPYVFADPSAPLSGTRYYRVLSVPAPSGMAVIPAGLFLVGDTLYEGGDNELPVHFASTSGFCMDSNLVTDALWQQVYQWATNHGYRFENSGSSASGYNYSKGPTHPVHLVNWYDVLKWCNARSEMQALAPCYYTSSARTTVYRTGDIDLGSSWVNWSTNGYRLPTEAEWEDAARGGILARRFPWGDTNVITYTRANYYSEPESFSYDLSPTNGYNPSYSADQTFPYTSPAGYFAPNGYGLCDMAGNLWEWCWDWYDADWYANAGATQNDTRGPVSGPSGSRVLRGGSWYDTADYARCAYRAYNVPASAYSNIGFRCVRGF